MLKNNLEKLNKQFRINPLYESDGYKIAHPDMLAPNTTKEYFHWIPRSLKYFHKSIEKIISSGQQLTWRYIHSAFAENFFGLDKKEALIFAEDMSKYIGMSYNSKWFNDLYDLGYLPVRIKILPEGLRTKANIPHMTGINTIDGYAWLCLFLETLVSKLSWQMPIAATLAHKFRENANEWTLKTDPENMFLTDYMCHDFHSRGGNPFTSIAVGLGHSLSNSGSDTLNVIPASRYYYDADEDEVIISSVNASEHSVTCTGIFFYEKQLKEGKLDHEIKKYYDHPAPCDGNIDNPDYLAIAELLNLRDWLIKFPNGILSVVSDTFDLWKLITFILPRLKEEILARDGKLVIRPDSGDPVDIICGVKPVSATNEGLQYRQGTKPEEIKGVVELLWNIFGGTTTSTGYKLLDSHIGCIYGDSINLDRQVTIYERLASKGFSVTNVVLGIGSYTFVYGISRDTAGLALKGAWFEIKRQVDSDPESTSPDKTFEIEQFDIYKDPITDDGTKKSLRGKVKVYYDENNEIQVKCQVTDEEENEGLLQVIYEDGKFYNQTTIPEIRKRLFN